MKNSLKQLFRTPGKTLLFFVMMTAAAMLLVFGAELMTDSLQKLRAADEQFATVGAVEQKPDWDGMDEKGRPVKRYDEILSPETLNFEGADYVVPPEARSYCLTYTPKISRPGLNEWSTGYGEGVAEFSPAEDLVLGEGEDGLVEVTLKHFLTRRQSTMNVEMLSSALGSDRDKENAEILRNFTDGGRLSLRCSTPVALEKGKTYIASVWMAGSWDEETREISFHMQFQYPPYSTQADSASAESWMVREDIRTGALEPDDIYNVYYRPGSLLYDEVTENFYDTQKGRAWQTWADLLEHYPGWWYVLPTGGMNLLPSFRNAEIRMAEGREITKEEFASGAKVCMVPVTFARQNFLTVGDKVTLPLYCSLRNYVPTHYDINAYNSTISGVTTIVGSYEQNFQKGYSPLDENLELYEPFWEEEYEIVGVYRYTTVKDFEDRYETELPREVFIIPSNSVGASDEGHVAYNAAMNPLTASFQIKNGTIQEFDAKLRASVPEAERFSITYSDGGYGELRASLDEARLTAVLLFGAGVLAAVSIVALLLYFFVVKQKKRTAIERSLGMSKGRCRRSILSGLMALTAAACALGSGLGALLMKSPLASAQPVQNTGDYLPYFSLWAITPKAEVILDPGAAALTLALYLAVPLALALCVYLLARLLIRRSLKIEPILLLSGKTE